MALGNEDAVLGSAGAVLGGAGEVEGQWWWGKKTYTAEEIQVLIDAVKVFNAGAIDQYLTNHVDKVFEAWKKDMNA